MKRLVQKRIQENREAIESAALSLFTSQGFHGTNIREIAELAGLSVGAMYSYYPNKESLYVSVVRSVEVRISDLRAEMLFGANDEDPFSRVSLRAFADGLRTLVRENADYWRLMYIDVVEFRNAHFADNFQNVVEQFRERYRVAFQRVVCSKEWCGHEPAFVYATLYHSLLTYFLIESLFGGKQHLGMPEEEAIDRMIDLAIRGFWTTHDLQQDPENTRNESARKTKKKSTGALANGHLNSTSRMGTKRASGKA